MACKYTLDGQVLSELEFKQEVARRFANKPIDLNEIAKDFSVAKTEVSTQKLADLYKGRLDKLKKENPDQYWSVDMPSDEVINEAAKNGRIVDKNGGMGIVTEDGNMIGLFKYDESKKGTAKSVEDERIKMGGIKKDNFDGYLTKQYEKNGFKVVSRTPFSEEHAPEGWNKEKHGTPDVVFMVHDPEGKLDIKEKTFGSYDDAKAYQGKYANEAKANIEKPKQETKAEKPLSKK